MLMIPLFPSRHPPRAFGKPYQRGEDRSIFGRVEPLDPGRDAVLWSP